MMRKVVFLFALAMFVFVAPVYAQDRVINVNGEANVSVEPDMATINIGVETQNADPVRAQAENSATMDRVLAAIMVFGIEESDIRTAWFNMHPVHDWGMFDTQPQIVGHMVSNNISITVRDIEIVGQILSAATEAGANAASNVSFGLSDSSAAYNQALTLAIADAQAKGQIVASALGVTLGDVLHISEGGSMGISWPMAPRSEMWFGGGVGFASADMGVPFHRGELDVFARVNVTFTIR